MLVMCGSAMPPADKYYVPFDWDDHTIMGLERAIHNTAFTVPYSLGEFDCSEMAAFMEWYLQNKGFHVQTYIGHQDEAVRGYAHAWLAVDVITSTGNDTIYVDPMSGANITTNGVLQCGIISMYCRNDSLYDWYSQHNYVFEDIFDFVARTGLENEIDWWNNIAQVPQGSSFTVRVNRTYETIKLNGPLPLEVGQINKIYPFMV